MTRYATTTAAAMVLLTSLTFDCDVWLLRTAASEWDAAPPVPRTYGTGGLDRRRAYADNPSYVSGGGGVGDDDDDDGVTDGQNPSQHEDQLDQDDPGNTGLIISNGYRCNLHKNSLSSCKVHRSQTCARKLFLERIKFVKEKIVRFIQTYATFKTIAYKLHLF